MERKHVVLGIVGAILLIVLLVIGGWAFRWFAAPIEGQVGARENIQSAEYRVYSYDHFYNLYADIQAYEDQIRNQRQMLDEDIGEEEKRTYRQNINGLMNMRASAIRQYNADARKEETRGQFRDDGLPYQINIEFE